MGYEYTIKFIIDDDQEVAELLKALPYFQEAKHFKGKTQYIYRSPENTGQMPSGFAEIEASGIHFCDYGGGEILKEIIFQIALCYKQLEIIDHSD